MRDESEVRGGWGAEVGEFFDGGEGLRADVATVAQEAEDAEEGEGYEEDEVEDEEDGGEDSLRCEVVGEEMENDGEDPCVH